MALLWTTSEDVTGRWLGEPLTATTAQIQTLLEDAEDTVAREFPDLQTRIDDGSLPLLRVRKVVARMVIRHLRNPAGERSRMDVGGPYTQNVVFGGENPGSIYMTDEDRAELTAARVGKAFTIDTAPASGNYTWLTPTTWEPTV